MIMEPEPNDVIILSAISQGSKKFDKIRRKTQIEVEELNSLLERLENKGFIIIVEKKGFFGPKKEIELTEKGKKEFEERRFELQKNWDSIVALWKNGDEQELQQYVDNNRSTIPSMMFLGIMDMVMFSSMMSFIGLAMSSFMPDQFMYDSCSPDTGHDAWQGGDYSGGDFGHGDGGPGDMGGFDENLKI
jgi:DNA-binding HxlR family transcriptional regulator